MSRNTHDRQLDHHGEDLDTNVVLDGAIGPIASGSTVHEALQEIYDNGSVSGGYAWKQIVTAATTDPGTLATDFANGSNVGGHSVVTGQRILIKNQTNSSENGIYIVQASGAPVRADDANTGEKLIAAAVSIPLGIVYGTLNGTSWYCTNQTAPVLGTDNILFEQIRTYNNTPFNFSESESSLYIRPNDENYSSMGESVYIYGNNSDIYEAGDVSLWAGSHTPTDHYGSGIGIYGAGDNRHGKVSIFTNNSSGNAGDVLTSDGEYASWEPFKPTRSLLTEDQRACQSTDEWSITGGIIEADYNPEKVTLLVTGQDETVVTLENFYGAYLGSPNYLKWDFCFSQNGGSSKELTIKIKKGAYPFTTSGTLVTSTVIAAPDDADDVTGHQSRWSGSYTDTDPSSGDYYYFTIEETGGDSTTEIWSDGARLVVLPWTEFSVSGNAAYGQEKCLVIRTKETSCQASLTINSAVSSGKTYAFVSAWKACTPGVFFYKYMVAGYESCGSNQTFYRDNTWSYTVSYLTPTDNYSEINLYFDIYSYSENNNVGAIGWIDVVEISEGSLLPLYHPIGVKVATPGPVGGPYQNTIDVLSGMKLRQDNRYISFQYNGLGMVDENLDGYETGVWTGVGNSEMWSYHELDPGWLAYRGVKFGVGTDELAMYISEKDSTTIEMYPEWSDVVLSDNPDGAPNGMWIIDGGTP